MAQDTEYKTRRTITPEQKIAWGEEYISSPLNRSDFARKIGIAESQLDTYTRAYELMHERVEFGGTMTDQKAMAIVEILRGDRKPRGKRGRPKKRQTKAVATTKPAVTKPINGSLTVLNGSDDLHVRVRELEAQNSELIN